MADVTPHSAVEFLLPHQVASDPTINTGFSVLDKSVHGLLTKAVTSDDVTLSATEAEQSGYIRVTGLFTANRSLVLPNNSDTTNGPRAKFYTVENAGTGGFTLTVKTVSGAGVTIAQGNAQSLYVDGVNVVAVGAATGSGGGSWDMHPYLPGLPGAGAIFYRTKMIRALRIPAGFSLSLGSSEIAATASKVFSFKKAGVEFGTATFAIGASVSTFIAATNTDFAAGNEFRIDAPAVQDVTLAGVQFSIAATKL